MNFLGYPETIPDSTTIWLFRERLKEKNKNDAIWQEVQRQLDAKGLILKEDSILPSWMGDRDLIINSKRKYYSPWGPQFRNLLIL